jgi:hypothetical protein
VRLRTAALWSIAAMLLLPSAGRSQSTAPATVAPVAARAEVGIQLTAVGGAYWAQGKRKRYFSPAVMTDIRDHLHASFVRIGWFPSDLRLERIAWRREDQGLDTICASGLHVMFLLPSPKDDPKGNDDLQRSVGAFLDRYTHREFGCIRWAEAGNESDLVANGFKSVDDYATYYESVAPIVAAYGVKVITSGVSGEDRPWTQRLAQLLRASDPQPPVAGYGFHPYGVEPAQMAVATMAMRQAAGALGGDPLPEVYVTEIGERRADDLYRTIVTLSPVTPAIALYEYLPQEGEDATYAIKSNPSLYAAVARAQACLQAQSAQGLKCVGP